MNDPWLLTKKDQYSAVYRKGDVLLSSLVVMKFIPNGLNCSRYGFSVSKAVGNAVIRNKVKRRLREICRLQVISPGWDIVLIARRESSIAKFYKLRDVVIRLLVKAGLLYKDCETTGTNSN